MIITSKFSSLCWACGERIHAGTTIDYRPTNRRGRKTRHVQCPAPHEAASMDDEDLLIYKTFDEALGQPGEPIPTLVKTTEGYTVDQAAWDKLRSDHAHEKAQASNLRFERDRQADELARQRRAIDEFVRTEKALRDRLYQVENRLAALQGVDHANEEKQRRARDWNVAAGICNFFRAATNPTDARFWTSLVVDASSTRFGLLELH